MSNDCKQESAGWIIAQWTVYQSAGVSASHETNEQKQKSVTAAVTAAAASDRTDMKALRKVHTLMQQCIDTIEEKQLRYGSQRMVNFVTSVLNDLGRSHIRVGILLRDGEGSLPQLGSLCCTHKTISDDPATLLTWLEEHNSATVEAWIVREYRETSTGDAHPTGTLKCAQTAYFFAGAPGIECGKYVLHHSDVLDWTCPIVWVALANRARDAVDALEQEHQLTTDAVYCAMMQDTGSVTLAADATATSYLREVATIGSIETDEDTALVNSLWKYRSGSSLPYIRDVVKKLSSSAIRVQTQLVAWILEQADGSIGMLHVLDDHRRKGLAQACIVNICQQLSKRCNYPAYCYIVCGNEASMTLFGKLGWSKVMDISWRFSNPT
jgi:ribosomal protein S18 acetylase RimI-like enzyme